MPRVSVRKTFVYVLGAGTFVLFILNLQQAFIGSNSLLIWNYPSAFGTGSGSGSGTGFGEETGNVQRDYGGDQAEERKEKRKEKIVDTYQSIDIFRVNSSRASLPHRGLDLSPLGPNDVKIPEKPERPWYMRGGEMLPKPAAIDPKTNQRVAQLFPEEAPDASDRVSDQLMFYPPPGTSLPPDPDDSSTPLKKILLWNGVNSWGQTAGRGVFLKEKCPVSACVITSRRSDADFADLVIFKDHFTMPTYKRPPNQFWMMYMLESPLHTQGFKDKDVFNWTATYRADSTIVAPYERWTYYNENVRGLDQGRNFAANKTKAVAWFVSNCGAKNGRLQYARELQKHIEVDIYGSCGSKKCPRSSSGKCFDMLDKDYKFYLAFENSNCMHYITEKFFVNGLGHDVVPIVMGARPIDYALRAPHHSYIHVDDFSSPKELAEYLHFLDKNDKMYNEYFRWKGTGEFVNTKFFCRVCALLHDPKVRDPEYSYIKDINQWWRGQGTCINGSWLKFYESLEKQRARAVQNDTKVEEEKAEEEIEPEEAKLP